jgi:hypothetical protein
MNWTQTTSTATTTNGGQRVIFTFYANPTPVAPPRIDPRVAMALRVLGLPLDADAAKIRREWRRLAHLHHPDHGGDATMFRKLREAYALLVKLGKV